MLGTAPGGRVDSSTEAIPAVGAKLNLVLVEWLRLLDSHAIMLAEKVGRAR